MVPEVTLAKILVVEDHHFSRKGLRQFLELEGFQPLEASDAQSAYTIIEQNTLAAAIIDIELPDAPGSQVRKDAGLQIARSIKENYPQVGVVLLSSHPDRGRQFWDLVGQGHRGLAYILKSGEPPLLIKAVCQTIDKQIYCDPQVTLKSQVVVEMEKRLTPEEKEFIQSALKALPTLTPREFEVASALSDSHDLKGIAGLLGIKENVVSNYITKIFEKLGLNNAPSHLSPRSLLIKAMVFCGLQNEDQH